jgi:YVTN family beta-propeller protein
VTVNQGSSTASFIDASAAMEVDRTPTGLDPVSIVVDRAGRRAYVFNRRSNSITALDIATHAVAASAATEPEPLRGQLNRAGDRLYVIHGGSAFMTVYAVPELTLQNRVFVGLGATAIKVDPRTDLIYVAVEGDRELRVYDPMSFIPVKHVEVPGAVGYMAIADAENTLYALIPERRTIAAIQLTSGRTLGLVDVGADPYAVVLAGERF